MSSTALTFRALCDKQQQNDPLNKPEVLAPVLQPWAQPLDNTKQKTVELIEQITGYCGKGFVCGLMVQVDGMIEILHSFYQHTDGIGQGTPEHGSFFCIAGDLAGSDFDVFQVSEDLFSVTKKVTIAATPRDHYDQICAVDFDLTTSLAPYKKGEGQERTTRKACIVPLAVASGILGKRLSANQVSNVMFATVDQEIAEAETNGGTCVWDPVLMWLAIAGTKPSSAGTPATNMTSAEFGARAPAYITQDIRGKRVHQYLPGLKQEAGRR